MIAAIRRAYANFRGFDLTGSAVPPMDGPLRPNAKLDACPVLLALPEVDNLTVSGSSLVCSAGSELLQLDISGSAEAPSLHVAGRRDMGRLITSIAADGAGALAFALEGEGIVLEGGRHDGRRLTGPAPMPVGCITAMAFSDPDTLLICSGSNEHTAGEWKRDLMTRNASGSVWRVDLGQPGGSPARIADRLAFPAGIAAADGTVFVSEAWRHRVLAIGPGGGSPRVALGNLPAYPGRIAKDAGEGFWLAMFAPRNPLVEFVLNEELYRQRMVATIDPAYWIAPSLLTGKSFLEPIQGGARKKLNRLKPWSPTWSWGLVVRCGADMQPLESWHSRADGDVHGVTSICVQGDRVLVDARGSGKIVAINSLSERAAE